ncbi:MAG: tetratricopeptide repeat protein [Acidobacteria bacterium]|nr:tetratricopeptide repeat protein [Acidobacteriota bacterium]
MAINRSKILAVADKYIAQQKYDKALNELLKLVQSSPNDTNLLNKIGDLYSQLGNTKSAIPYFEKVAESYRKGGFYPKTIALYKKIIRMDPAYMEGREKLVDLFIQQGHNSEAKAELKGMSQHYLENNLPARAMAALEKIVQIEPNNLDARIKLTEILIREGKNDEASAHFYKMGQELLEKNMVQEARKILSQAVKFDERNVKIQVLLARTILAEGKVDEAIKHLTELCESNPREVEGVLTLGRAYLSKQMYSEAKACFLRAAHIDPSQTHALEDVAKQLIEAGLHDEAFEALIPVADGLLRKGDSEEATRLFRLVLYANERHKPSLEKLVAIYKSANQLPNAILTFEKLINYCLEEGDQAAAKDYILQLLELDPDNLEWRSRMDSLGGGAPLVLEKQEAKAVPVASPEPKPVVEEVDQSSLLSIDGSQELSMEPDDPETQIQNHLTEADVFMKYGIIDQALTHLLAIIDINPRHFDANQKLKQIYMDRREPDKAVACLTNMASIAMEQGDLGQAEDLLNEAEEIKPGISRLYRGQLESLRHKDRTENDLFAQGDGFELDLASPPSEEVIAADQIHFEEPKSDLVIEDVAAHDVLDMKILAQDAAEIEDWSLDIPRTDAPKSEPSMELDFSVGDAHEMLADEINLDEPVAFEDSVEHTEVLEPEFEEPAIDAFDESDLEIFEQEDESASRAFDSGSIEVEDFDHLDLVESSESVDDSLGLEVPIEVEPQPEPTIEAKLPPQPPPVPVAASSPPPVPAEEIEEIEEIEFFLSMDAVDDARNLLREALEKYGRVPELVAYEEQLLPKLPSAPQPSPSSSTASGNLFESDGTGFFDLAAELQDEIFDEDISEVTDNASQEEIQSVDELFEEFKKGVAEQIDDEDYETHYDLGIAYKEMGLVEESIKEFEKAMGDNSRFMECTAMIGACLIELGRSEEAVSHYERALTSPNLKPEDRLAITYECGLANEGLGELDRALELFRSIQNENPKYRDVESRIAALV